MTSIPPFEARLANAAVLPCIERREPDASLFQIPADYTIEERAQDSNRIGPAFQLRTFPTPNFPQ